MSEYNIQMNKYNALNAEYDQLYPQPMKHASTHAKDGDDPITPSSIGAAELGADGKVLASQIPSIEVDAYTKVQTLSDTTKTLFGLDATAVPDDALALLSRFQKGLGNEYVWAKYEAVKMAVDSGSSSYRMSSNYSDNTFGKSVKLNGDTIELDAIFTPNENPNSNTVNYWSNFIPFYFYDGYRIRRVISISGSGSTYIDFTASEQVIGIQAGDFVGYVNSPDPSAYPPAVSDGYTYTAFGQLGQNMTKIQAGSYIGTQTFGSSNPNTLTFDFVPKIVIISTKLGKPSVTETGFGDAFYVWGNDQFYVPESSNFQINRVSTNEKTMSWYHGGNGQFYGQLNADYTYFWVAIG